MADAESPTTPGATTSKAGFSTKSTSGPKSNSKEKSGALMSGAVSSKRHPESKSTESKSESKAAAASTLGMTTVSKSESESESNIEMHEKGVHRESLDEGDADEEEDVREIIKCVQTIGQELTCSICYSLIKDPLMTPCRHVFCRNCLQRSLSIKERCPLCKTPVNRRSTRPCEKLVLLIRHYKQLHPHNAKYSEAPVVVDVEDDDDDAEDEEVDEEEESMQDLKTSTGKNHQVDTDDLDNNSDTADEVNAVNDEDNNTRDSFVEGSWRDISDDEDESEEEKTITRSNAKILSKKRKKKRRTEVAYDNSEMTQISSLSQIAEGMGANPNRLFPSRIRPNQQQMSSLDYMRYRSNRFSRFSRLVADLDEGDEEDEANEEEKVDEVVQHSSNNDEASDVEQESNGRDEVLDSAAEEEKEEEIANDLNDGDEQKSSSSSVGNSKSDQAQAESEGTSGKKKCLPSALTSSDQNVDKESSQVSDVIVEPTQMPLRLPSDQSSTDGHREENQEGAPSSRAVDPLFDEQGPSSLATGQTQGSQPRSVHVTPVNSVRRSRARTSGAEGGATPYSAKSSATTPATIILPRSQGSQSQSQSQSLDTPLSEYRHRPRELSDIQEDGEGSSSKRVRGLRINGGVDTCPPFNLEHALFRENLDAEYSEHQNENDCSEVTRDKDGAKNADGSGLVNEVQTRGEQSTSSAAFKVGCGEETSGARSSEVEEIADSQMNSHDYNQATQVQNDDDDDDDYNERTRGEDRNSEENSDTKKGRDKDDEVIVDNVSEISCVTKERTVVTPQNPSKKSAATPSMKQAKSDNTEDQDCAANDSDADADGDGSIQENSRREKLEKRRSKTTPTSRTSSARVDAKMSTKKKGSCRLSDATALPKSKLSSISSITTSQIDTMVNLAASCKNKEEGNSTLDVKSGDENEIEIVEQSTKNPEEDVTPIRRGKQRRRIKAKEDSQSEQRDPNEEEEEEDNAPFTDVATRQYSVGEMVTVARRMWPGMNKPGGVGRITKVNDDNTYGVRFTVEGRREKRVEAKYLTPGIDVNNSSLMGNSLTESNKPTTPTVWSEKRRSQPRDFFHPDEFISQAEYARIVALGSDSNANDNGTLHTPRGRRRSRSRDDDDKSQTITELADESNEGDNSETQSSVRKRRKSALPRGLSKSTGQNRKRRRSQVQSASPVSEPASDAIASSSTHPPKPTKTKRRARSSSPARSKIECPLIVLTSLSSESLRQKIVDDIHRLNGEVELDDVAKATHLVVPSMRKSSDGRIAKARTIKYVRAIAAGRWVVDVKWVRDSARANTWLPEESYEIEGDMKTLEIAKGGPKRSREEHQGREHGSLLASYIMHLSGSFASSRVPPKRDLEEVFTTCGGKLVSNLRELQSARAEMKSQTEEEGGLPCVVVCEDLNTARQNPNFKDITAQPNVHVVTPQWLLNTVSTYKIQDVTSYLAMSDEQ